MFCLMVLVLCGLDVIWATMCPSVWLALTYIISFWLYQQKRDIKLIFLVALPALPRQLKLRVKSFTPACRLWAATMAILLMPMFLLL